MLRLFTVAVAVSALASTALAVDIDITGADFNADDATTFTLNHVAALGGDYWGTWTWNSTTNRWDLVGYGENTGGGCDNPLHPVADSGIGTPGTTGWPNTLANICTVDEAGTIVGIGVDRWNLDNLTWDVYLWDINCNLMGSATVSGGTGWFWAPIPEWTVNPGDQFYVGYTVSDGSGSYIYRDTASPVDVGPYTVDYANYHGGGLGCPTSPNGGLVSPVDVEFCPSAPAQSVVSPQIGLSAPVSAATD